MNDMSELIRLARKGREAEGRSKALVKFCTAAIVGIGNFLLRGLALMLLLGILHGHWQAVPAIGYWPSCAAAFLLHMVLTDQRVQTNAGAT